MFVAQFLLWFNSHGPNSYQGYDWSKHPKDSFNQRKFHRRELESPEWETKPKKLFKPFVQILVFFIITYMFWSWDCIRNFVMNNQPPTHFSTTVINGAWSLTINYHITFLWLCQSRLVREGLISRGKYLRIICQVNSLTILITTRRESYR